MKLLKQCPDYIRRDYPQEAHKWEEFRAEVIGFNAIASDETLSRADKWKTLAAWWLSWPQRASESHGGSISSFYKCPFPWANFGRFAGMLSRGYYISIETSDCAVQTLAEYTED